MLGTLVTAVLGCCRRWIITAQFCFVVVGGLVSLCLLSGWNLQVYVVCSTDAWAAAEKKGWYQVDMQKGGYIQCTSLQQPIQLTNVSAQVDALQQNPAQCIAA